MFVPMNGQVPRKDEVPEEVPHWPQVYRIVVGGRLDARWADQLADLAITPGEDPTSAATTTLEGPIRDQAELSGVLNALYDLHLPLLSVEIVGEEPGIRSQESGLRKQQAEKTLRAARPTPDTQERKENTP